MTTLFCCGYEEHRRLTDGRYTDIMMLNEMRRRHTVWTCKGIWIRGA